MHFHVGAGVSKLVRCARGRDLDVAVDLRRGSPTYGQWEAVELDEQSMRELYVPVGFAHGFCVLSELADVIYKQTAYYDPELERGIAYNDPDVGIEWPLPAQELVVSERDAAGAAAGASWRASCPSSGILNGMHSGTQRLRERTNGYTVTAQQYVCFAYVALVALTVIVLTGAAVRLTGSGLGCPTWPKCYGNVYPPLNSHAVIEFSNRALTVPVSIAAGARVGRGPAPAPLPARSGVAVGRCCRSASSARRCSAASRSKAALDYGWVMGHFALSMLILLAAVVLVWRAVGARREVPGGERVPVAAQAHGAGSHAGLVGARARRARGADDLRRHGRDGRRSARRWLARSEDQSSGLRRARDDGLRDPSPRRDRARVQRRGGGRVVACAAAVGPTRCCSAR